MDKKKITYMCSGFPFPANTGGMMALAQHILELKQLSNYFDIQYIFADCNENKINNTINTTNYIVYQFEHINKSYFAKLMYYIFVTLFSFYPIGLHMNKNEKIKEQIKHGNNDIVILDDIWTFPLLPKEKLYKLIYIAHNIEYDYFIDLARLEKRGILYKIKDYIDAIKIKYIEKKLLNISDKIVCISTSDYKYFKNIYPSKVVFLPHKITQQQEKWNGCNVKTLFFCGSMDFPPNYEAIKWIATTFADTLSKDINIKIAGKGTDNVPEEWKKDNIEYLGFVSREELLELYRNCSAFICPIVYGSGVKIKVTEALGFGTPVIATKEALEGLDYIDIKPLIDRSDLQKTKENIEMLLNNQSKLQEYSSNLISQIETYQRKNDNSLKKIIGECIDE